MEAESIEVLVGVVVVQEDRNILPRISTAIVKRGLLMLSIIFERFGSQEQLY